MTTLLLGLLLAYLFPAMQALATAFAGTPALRWLNLNGAPLSDSGVYHLARHLRDGPPPGQARVLLYEVPQVG
jgi:hypothetical protein